MQVIEDFKNRLTANSLSYNTVRKYTAGMRDFFVKTNISQPTDITNDIVIKYCAEYRPTGGQSKMNGFLAGLSIFIKYYDIKNVQIPKGRRAKTIKTRVPLTDEEFKTLMQRIDYDFCNKPLKIKALIAFFVKTGLRESEVEALHRADVEGKRSLVLNQKKTKEPRPVLINIPLKTVLDRYFASEPEVTNLFNMKAVTMNYWVNKACREILGRNGFPHLLRHTFVTNCHIAKVDTKTIQRFVGHASIEQTEAYLHSNDKIMMDEMREKLESAEAESGEL